MLVRVQRNEHRVKELISNLRVVPKSCGGVLIVYMTMRCTGYLQDLNLEAQLEPLLPSASLVSLESNPVPDLSIESSQMKAGFFEQFSGHGVQNGRIAVIRGPSRYLPTQRRRIVARALHKKQTSFGSGVGARDVRRLLNEIRRRGPALATAIDILDQ